MSAPAMNAFGPAPVRIAPRIVSLGRDALGRVGQLRHHLVVQRVQLVGAVDGDERDPVADVEEQGLVVHGGNPTLRKLEQQPNLRSRASFHFCSAFPLPRSRLSFTSMSIQAITWAPSGAVRIVDQRALPEALVHRDLDSVEAMADAIRTLQVRGAPLIGIAAAMGLVAGLRESRGAVARGVSRPTGRARPMLGATRPTAVNLRWALERMTAVARAHAGRRGRGLGAVARRGDGDLGRGPCDVPPHRRGGAALLPDGANVLTHCNAGALATGGIGTALAPVYVAREAGRQVHVYVDETRPVLQGARLTAWELTQAGVPCTLITDSVAASLMRGGARRSRAGRRRSHRAQRRLRQQDRDLPPGRRWRVITASRSIAARHPRPSTRPSSTAMRIPIEQRVRGRGDDARRPSDRPGRRRGLQSGVRRDARALRDRLRHRPRRRPAAVRAVNAVLALDQGTTGSTALVIGGDGAVLGRGYRELPQHFPAPGQVEHDPEDILRVTLEAAQEAIARARVVPACIGITNQRETVCVWERATGRPLHRAIVWQDRRTAPRCAALARDARAATRSASAPASCSIPTSRRPRWNGCWSTCSAVRERIEARRRGLRHRGHLARCSGSPTGRRFATDHTNASRTMLYDLARGRLERRAARTVRRAARGAARGAPLERRVRGDDAAALRRGDPHHRRRRRPAGRAVRSGLLDRGAGEEHLRDRRLPVAEHGRAARRVDAWALDAPSACDAGGRAGVRARGQRLHRRRGDPVAARRAPDPRRGRRIRAARPGSPGHAAACTSSPRSSGSARRTGSPTRAARSSA